ncbi:glycosyltransferase 87 family protein [Actinoplanes sp. KI2]|uniref:glycosyltransferase 87 family protein n=1 Tax=Actinoplanes sp. KI2 TaxID=2983315 RepID=UPI0021D5F2EF|nr:glycosyltransferase 87 family protein [Actinoplanes sp. KI2]MCU7722125.1 glycosyltransferase 87 family protein [Actinoplanes sp. KI2]
MVILGGIAAGLAIIDLQQAYGMKSVAANRHASGLAALLLSPLSALPVPFAGLLLALVGVVALGLAMIVLAGPVARRYGKSRFWAVLAAIGLALPVAPVRATLGLGCLDLLLFGLVIADVVALRRSAWARSRAVWWPGPRASRAPGGRLPALLRRGWHTGAWAGLGTGIATALTLGPGLFVAYFAVTRQWRAALTALGTAVALLGGAALIAPGPFLRRSAPLADPLNQSLAGVLARLYHSASTPVLIWLSFAGLLAAVGLIRARSAHADGDEVTAFTLVGLSAAVVGPVTRIHEMIWLLPAVLVLVDAAARRRVIATTRRARRFPGIGFAVWAGSVYLLLVVDPRWTSGWNGYAFAVILLLNALPWRPGAASAVPARRVPQEVRRVPAIPGPRGR